MNSKKLKFGILIFTFIFFATLSFLTLKDGNESSAASLANFKAGKIMSDYVMSNSSSMTEAEIQSFLKSKNSCNKAVPSDYKDEGNGVYSKSFSDGGKTYYYHGKNGKFVCLADEVFGEGTDYGETVKNGESASHIIWQASQDFKINPQVLIVLLEKEQSLITDTWPNHIQYRSATGYGCPDTSACDSKYYGFKNQIRNSAKLFRTVLDGGWTNYPIGNNYIKYNPDSSCGGSTVNIENLATSALYRYTPYQPNPDAISAGYGTAPCGAYGNRNFYLYFYDWFGDPTAEVPTAPKDSSTTPPVSSTDPNPKKKESTKAPENENNAPLGETTSSIEQQREARIEEVAKKYKDLGEKKGGVETNDKTGIYWQEYKNGFIVGNDQHGYYLSAGEIRKVWKKNNFESGFLGYPISEMEHNQKTDTYYQEYEGGFIVGDWKHGYHVSAGEIRKVWAERGFESGDLGAMISEMEYNSSFNSYSQAFEKGYVIGSGKTGYFVSMGRIREIWKSSGSETGKYGFPTGNIIKNGKNYSQKFEHGTISV